MPDLKRSRLDLVEGLDVLRAHCERLGDMLTGLAVLFGATAALIIAAGVWSGEPLFAVSSGFALAAAVAFAASAHATSRAAKAAPRVQPAYVRPRKEDDANWRRAA